MLTSDNAFPIDDVLARAQSFHERLQALKASLEPRDFWYPYASAVDNVFLMSQILREDRRDLRTLIGGGRIADIGAADGELAFFMESLGCRATIVDYRATNFNGLRGAHRLKDALGSQVEILDKSLDDDPLFFGWHDLTFFLGTLYHFKNPLGALNLLARSSRYCFLSTRVIRTTPDKRLTLSGHAFAYLVDTFETNRDPTNFWMFTEPGLRTLVERSGWKMLDYGTFGNRDDSDPQSVEGDERAFALMRSELVE